jgi:hypothetical protein
MNVGHQGFRSYLILIEPLEDILTTVEALHYLLCVALDLDQRSTGEMKKEDSGEWWKRPAYAQKQSVPH